MGNEFMSKLMCSIGAWFFFFLASEMHSLADANEWVEYSQNKGVTIFKSKYADSSVLSVRGDTQISASIPEILDVLKDNSRAAAWMPHVAEKRDISYSDTNERIEYTHVDMPWPMRDRFFINRGKMIQKDDGTVIVSVESVDAPEFSEKNKVRGWIHYSEFILRPISGQLTYMSVQVNCDPNGAIPKWMVNIAQLDWPADFLLGLQKELHYRKQLQDNHRPAASEQKPLNTH